MPPRKATTAEIKQSKTAPLRIQVLASPRQREIIADYAEKAGSNSSTFVLAHVMKAIGQYKTGDEIPMVIGGKVADRIRTLADQQGISPTQFVEQLALGADGG